MIDIATVIGWKFNHQSGMCTVGDEITEFPGGIPTLEEQALWTAEYEVIEGPKLVQAELTLALENYYDQVAQVKKYDNRLTCALRAGYAGPFQSEGIQFAIWMDTCNEAAYTIMDAVLAGNRGIPTAEQLISELPTPPWSPI